MIFTCQTEHNLNVTQHGGREYQSNNQTCVPMPEIIAAGKLYSIANTPVSVCMCVGR